MKKVLVISTSLRTESNSDALAAAFAKGAMENGNEVEQISLRGKNIQFCCGCFACHTAGVCAIKDDSIAIVQKMFEADAIAFATPIYYYEMSGQMKTLLDRANSLFDSDYHFRDIYLLTAAADEGAETPKRAEDGLGGWIECFEKARLAGSVFAGGVNAMGEIEGHPALEEAFALGKAI